MGNKQAKIEDLFVEFFQFGYYGQYSTLVLKIQIWDMMVGIAQVYYKEGSCVDGLFFRV